MTKQELNTRDKIMDVAHELFAKNGFDAVSVRDISNKAEVNISAISYHFENKLGLFRSVMQNSIESIVEDLERIYNEQPNLTTLEYISQMFDFFTSNKLRLMSSFKFFMSMSEVFEGIEVDCLKGDKPPGGEIIEILLKRENPSISEEDLGWAIRSIAALTFHKSIIACNETFLEQKKEFGITRELFKQDLLRSSKLIVDSL